MRNRLLASRIGFPGVGIRLVWLLLVVFVAGSCTQVDIQTPAPRIVRIGGATSMRPVLEALAIDFATNNPGILIEVQGGGSTIGEAKVSDRRLQLGASTLLPNNAATTNSQKSGVQTAQPPTSNETLQRAPIGVDSIAVIVNEHNPIEDLAALQLHEVYSGRILNWNELGGNQGSIVLVSREDGSGARAAFESRIMGDTQVSLTAIVMPSSSAVVDYVATNPMAIGYVSSAFISEEYATVMAKDSGIDSKTSNEPKIRALSIDGVPPTDAAVKSNSYPIIQPLYLVTNGQPTGWVKDFVDYALSPAGQEIVYRYHTPVR